MENQQIELIGIVKKENLYRKRKTQDSNYEQCSFDLECSFIEHIWCPNFLPNMIKGHKVKVIGIRSKESNTIRACSVEMIKDEPLKQKCAQLKLETFNVNQQVKGGIQ